MQHAPATGRGATVNTLSMRFDDRAREHDGDWRDDCLAVDGASAPLRTTVTIERPRTILTRNTSPDLPFDRSVNAYRGCEHGCVYCFARPTHAYHNLSPGLDFETRLFAKPDAPALLAAELSRRGYACKPLALGTNTDPYQPIERDWRITRGILEVLARFRHPVTITTKSDRVLRDLDILVPMAADGLAHVMMSVTTLDARVARTLEPRAAAPHRRLGAIRRLADVGVPVFISVSPVVPGITDHEIEAIVAAGAAAGACGACSLPLRLPHEVAPIFRAWLADHYPDRAARVMALVNDMRGGRDNDPGFFTRFRGQGAYAEMLRQRFTKAVARAGLDGPRPMLDCARFAVPTDQPSLFDDV